MALAAQFSGGLADPVLGAQSIFRRVMDAMAQPGSIVDLADHASAPMPLDTATASFVAALADYDTPVWFEAEASDEAQQWVTFQTGAPIAGALAEAAFAVLSLGSSVDAWSRFPIGTASYPDRSATLLLPIHSFESGSSLMLTGPGIEARTTITVAGLPDGFVPAMSANHSSFPLGFDVILTAGSRLLALPRSTRIEEC